MQSGIGAKVRLVLVAIFLAAPGAVARGKDKKKDPEQIGNRDVGKGVNLYSFEKEIALGKQMAQEVEREAKIIEDPVIAEYVNRVGQNLVRNSDAKVPFTIKVVDSEEVNAFALPGGFFFVNSGLVLRADNEAELAGVMAHEIAHVAARHGTRQATRGEIANYASLPLIFMGGWAGLCDSERGECHCADWVPEVLTWIRGGSGPVGPAVLVQDGVRSDCLHRLFRENRDPGEDQTGHPIESVFDPSDDGRPDQGGTA